MKTMGQRLGVVLCIALALLSAFYAFVVRRVHSGTSFWMIWLVIAIILILLAICSNRLIVKRSPSHTECHYCSDLYRHCGVRHCGGVHHQQNGRACQS